MSCFGRRRHRGLFYCVQKGEHPAGKLDRSSDCDQAIHRRHLHNRIFRQGRGWPRTGGKRGSSSRCTACSLERFRPLGAAYRAIDSRSIKVALPIAENLADVHAVFLSADRAGGINVVAFDVKSKAEFLEIKHSVSFLRPCMAAFLFSAVLAEGFALAWL